MSAPRLPPGPIPEALWPLLLADLYALDGRRRASEVFDRLLGPLEEARNGCIAQCRAALRELDALEARVRARDERAARRAAVLACDVACTLQALAASLPEERT